ncbi:MAG TPA: hypothetical protein PL009_06285 [Flavipsychrobacter sp.]|nr:hypothetical protein [Flavipsychrobacter sp.]
MRKGFLIALLCMMLTPSIGNAQGCSVCTKTAAGLDSKAAKGMNGGIIYLAAFPLAILGTLGFIWWRGNRPVKQ